MKKTRKILLSLAVLGVIGSLAGFGTWSAFPATTTNTGNSYTAGSVQITQHSGATTLYTGAHAAPGHSTTGCVRVTYGATLPASVKLYASSITNGTSFHLTVERGSGITAPDNTMTCTGFTPSSTAFDGSLDTMPTSYAAGVDGKDTGTAWAQADSVDYRFTITVKDDATPNAHTSELGTGAHSFTWEARSN